MTVNSPPESNQAPLPVMTGEGSGARTSGEWRSSPRVIRDAYVVDIFLCCIVLLVALVTGFLKPSQQPAADEMEAFGNYVGAGFLALLAVGFGWQAAQLKTGRPSAWRSQIAASIVGLLVAAPIGAILSIILLLKWFKPEVKAWFGVA